MAKPQQQQTLDLHGIRALLFDVGGTVFDWHGTVSAALAGAAERHGVAIDPAQLTNAWRRGMLQQVGQVRNGVLPWRNTDEMHRTALDGVLDGTPLAILGSPERDELNYAWHRLRAWPDAAPALARLRERYTLVVLSLLSFSTLVDCSRQAGIVWDGIISCEFLQRYKPDPATYTTAVRWLGLRPAQVMMVAAHNGDLLAAKAQGLRSAYVARAGEWGLPETRDLTPDPGVDVAAPDWQALADKLLA